MAPACFCAVVGPSCWLIGWRACWISSCTASASSVYPCIHQRCSIAARDGLQQRQSADGLDGATATISQTRCERQFGRDRRRPWRMGQSSATTIFLLVSCNRCAPTDPTRPSDGSSYVNPALPTSPCSRIKFASRNLTKSTSFGSN